jgi:hypothetical protein
MIGMVDATSWVQAFMIASKPAESSSGLYGSLAPARNVNPAEVGYDSRPSPRRSLNLNSPLREKEV